MDPLEDRLITLIADIGVKLGFHSEIESQASESAWVDVVWFDPRLSPHSLGLKQPNLRRTPALPVAGFEVEKRTALNAKHIKGSVSNLNNLGAQLGAIVVGGANLEALRRSAKVHSLRTLEELEAILLDRVYRWAYAESNPTTRIVVLSERQVVAWASSLGVPIRGAV